MNLLENFRKDAYFVSLSPIGSTEDIVQAIAEGINYPIATEESPLSQLIRYLKPRQLLLVFDNFEHLLDGVDIISDILQDAADVIILVTSRERLNLLGESILFIEGLVMRTRQEKKGLVGLMRSIYSYSAPAG